MTGPSFAYLDRACVFLVLAVFAAGCCDLRSPAGDEGRPTQLLVITIDTEAQRERSDIDHVKRLIWGDFGPGKREGIDEMMDVADAHGVTLSFFLDVLEELAWPGQISEVAQHIVARGHDLELHTHPDQLPPQALADLGLAGVDPAAYTDADARVVLNEARTIMAPWGVPAPVAYRAGAYRYSVGVVDILPSLGFGEDYDYNILGKSQATSAAHGEMPTFRFDDGLVEIPISYIDHCGVPDRFDDYTYLDEGFDVAYDDIRRYQDEHPRSVLVLMLHSWSLLAPDAAKQYFVYDGAGRRIAFDQFLAGLPSFVEVVSAREVHDRIARGEVSLDVTETTADLFP
jgi:hypothetical protein